MRRRINVICRRIHDCSLLIAVVTALTSVVLFRYVHRQKKKGTDNHEQRHRHGETQICCLTIRGMGD